MKHRELIPELMDGPNIKRKTLKKALSDIDKVNRWLGGHKGTLSGVQKLLQLYPQKKYSVLDLGSGNGELLKILARSFRKKDIKATLTGWEINPVSISIAENRSAVYPEITYVLADILDLKKENVTYDIIICSLTLHHFNDDEVLQIVSNMQRVAKLGIVINDLHRSRVALGAFSIISPLMMKTKLARHDGKISIKRGFKKEEIIDYAKKLNIKNYSLDWRWAYRYLWIIENQESK